MLIGPTYFSADNKSALYQIKLWVERTGNRGCEHLTDKTEKSSARILCSLGKHHTQSPTADFRCCSCFDVSQSRSRGFSQHKKSFFFFNRIVFERVEWSAVKCQKFCQKWNGWRVRTGCVGCPVRCVGNGEVVHHSLAVATIPSHCRHSEASWGSRLISALVLIRSAGYPVRLGRTVPHR